MISTMTRNKATTADTLRPLALLATGMSGADIERLSAKSAPAADEKANRSTWDLLEAALCQDDDSLSDAIRHRIAVHEIGHAFCYELTGVGNVISVRLHGLGGKTETVLDREKLQFEEGMLDNLVAIFGGRAAEEIVFGEKMVGSGGEPQSDSRSRPGSPSSWRRPLGLERTTSHLPPTDKRP